MYKIYEIKMGETLESIARKLGINPEVLATLNGISINTNLVPNTYIVVPSTDTLFETYIIQKGDTIYEIARRYNFDPMQLLKLNGLEKEEYIYPGEEIKIPKPGTSFYVTEEDDTINKVIEAFQITPNDLISQNPNIYITEDQLIVYRK